MGKRHILITRQYITLDVKFIGLENRLGEKWHVHGHTQSYFLNQELNPTFSLPWQHTSLQITLTTAVCSMPNKLQQDGVFFRPELFSLLSIARCEEIPPTLPRAFLMVSDFLGIFSI